MKKHLQRTIITIALLWPCLAALAQQLAVESFTRDDSDQTARIHSPRKDQNNKNCAIVKMETPLLLQDFTFDAGSVGIAHTEQKTGEVWIYLSPGAQRLTIQHKYLGTIRNYPFGEALREATVYILKLKSGNVKTVVEDNVALQYFVVNCAIDGATISIDDAEPEPFANGKFQKALSYGKHRYTVEAPMYHPESGITEITAQKAAPVTITLKPKFGKLTIHTQPEQGADVFIDEVKQGQSPLAIERLSSGTHKIRVMKTQFLPVAQEQTITDGATEALTLTMQPNFAVITLTTPDGGDIYINDEEKGAAPWSGRLTPGQYKVEVRKPSHRPSATTVASEAGKDKTVSLAAPSPIYGSLEIKGNVQADIFIDGENRGTTPVILNRILVGGHSVELQAAGYKPHQQTVEVEEGKMLLVSVTLQEEEKTGSLRITANTNNATASVSVDGTFIGNTPITVNDLSLGKKTVSFQASGYKPLTKTVTIMPGYNELYGELKEKPVIHSAWFISYRMSPPTSYAGLSVGYCKRLGVYLQYRQDWYGIGSNLADIDENFYGGLKRYARLSFTAGGMLRIFKFMYVYGGLGYGSYGTAYQVGEGSYKTYYTAGLIKGLELEYGATFRVWKFISLTAGYSTIAGSDFGELHFGIGLIFGKK